MVEFYVWVPVECTAIVARLRWCLPTVVRTIEFSRDVKAEDGVSSVLVCVPTAAVGIGVDDEFRVGVIACLISFVAFQTRAKVCIDIVAVKFRKVVIVSPFTG